MNIISYTNKGLRPKNEDSLLSEQLGNDISFHIIADGMGGYSHGEIAAKIVAETILDQVRQINFCEITEDCFINACKEANQKLQETGIALSSKLGTTFAATLIMEDTIFAFWMGDTRIYQYNEDNRLIFQSTDHSLINELRLSRTLTISDIQKYGSIVTRSLTGEFMEKPPQIEILKYSPKDIILLCSDGLYKQINPNAILEMSTEELLLHLASVEEDMTDNYSIIKIY